jgi:hypothetical protein
MIYALFGVTARQQGVATGEKALPDSLVSLFWQDEAKS